MNIFTQLWSTFFFLVIIGTSFFLLSGESSCDRINRGANLFHAAIGAAGFVAEKTNYDPGIFWSSSEFVRKKVFDSGVKIFSGSKPAGWCPESMDRLIKSSYVPEDSLQKVKEIDHELYEKLTSED